MMTRLILGLTKKTLYKKMIRYFPPYRSFGKNINVKFDLSNYATKTDVKEAKGNFALKSNLNSLKTEVDKLDIDKLVPVPADLSKVSDAVRNDTVKMTMFNKLVTKVNNIDTTGFF